MTIEKFYGRSKVSNSIMAAFAYLILGLVVVVFIKGGYTYITSLLGISFFVFDIGLFVLLMYILIFLANKCIELFKVEKLFLFKLLTSLIGIIFFTVYYTSEITATIAAWHKMFYIPLNISDLRIFLELKLELLSYPFVISRRGSELDLPYFVNYIFVLIVFIALVFPKGIHNATNMTLLGKAVTPTVYFIASEVQVNDESFATKLLSDSSNFRVINNPAFKGTTEAVIDYDQLLIDDMDGIITRPEVIKKAKEEGSLFRLYCANAQEENRYFYHLAPGTVHIDKKSQEARLEFDTKYSYLVETSEDIETYIKQLEVS